MSDDPDSHTLRYLRRLDSKVDRVLDLIADLSADVRGIMSHLAGFMQNEVAQDGSIASVRDRLDKIERRLDLREQDA